MSLGRAPGLLRRAAVPLLCAVVLSAAPAVSHAQPKPATATPAAPRASAASLVDRGRALYDDQLYEESIQTLSAALLRTDGTEQDKLQVYQYLAFDYIVLGRKDEAESAVRALLVLRPEFELPERESPRLREFFGQSKARWEAEGRPGYVVNAPPPPKVELKHQAPATIEEGKGIELSGGLSDPGERVGQVQLHVRVGTKGKFEVRPTVIQAGVFRTTLPGSTIKGPLVEYYFQALDGSGLPVAARGDAEQPFRLPVKERSSKGWVLPVAIGGGVIGAAAIVGVLALAGAFSPTQTTTVGFGVRE